MSRFFPMPRGDCWFLLAILAFCLISFLPWTRSVELAGLSLFGWMMAALMLLAPLWALLRLILRRKPGSRSTVHEP